MSKYNYEDPSNDFIQVYLDIWMNTKDITYHFRDETDNFVGPYKTEVEAVDALVKYMSQL